MLGGNRHFLISEAEKIVRLLLLLQATNTESEDTFSALKHVKSFLKSTMGNKRLHELMLMHVHRIFWNKFFNFEKTLVKRKRLAKIVLTN